MNQSLGAFGQAAPQQSLNLVTYLETLSAETRGQLYDSLWTCQALFRALDPLAQQYALRLLYVDAPVPDAHIQNWVKPQARSKHELVLGALRRLSLFQATKDERDGAPAWLLHPAFKARMCQALSGSGHKAQQVDDAVLLDAPTLEEITAYALKQWEGVLLFLLDPGQTPPSLPVGLKTEPLAILSLVEGAALLDEHRRLSAAGFRFLLLDTHSQMWLLLREYIRSAEAASGAQLCSALSFLMQLGFRRVGAPYPFEGLGPLERRIASHMAQLGLLCTFIAHSADRAAYFCPTPLAASLCGGFAPPAAHTTAGGGSGAVPNAAGGGTIIVETNFRVYAYTSSTIQGRVLEEVCRRECSLPNLFVGSLTRESVMGALAKGLSADDIIAFLRSHAHPQIAKRSPVVPENVMDQVRLWEAETKRVVVAPSYLYDQFESLELYEASLAYARHLGVLLWASADPTTRAYAVSRDGHIAVKGHIQALKAQAAQMGGMVA